MDYRVVFSQRSQADLRNIVGYISVDNPDTALRLGEDLIAALEDLESFPHRGKRFDENEWGVIYELPCRGYRAFYRIAEGQQRVEVLHIRHGARSEPRF